MNLHLRMEYYPKQNDEILKNSLEIVKRNKEKWQEPFFTDTESYVDLEKIKETSKEFLDESLENVIVLGTGGSIQTFMSLRHLAKRKTYPITNSRAVELKECLDNTDPSNSVVIPISRSGETLDINSTIGTFVNEGYNFLGLSSRGTMNALLKSLDNPILGVPDLSGRFAGSITNVGIVPSYLAGIDVEKFLESLNEGYELYMNWKINPALEFASYIFNLYRRGYKVMFMMPYSKNLEGAVGLFIQEISESTGKEGKGLMGAAQESPLAQHSVLEYLLGGPKGAVIPIILTLENEEPDVKLESSIDYVDGTTAQTIVNYQADATFQALLDQMVPSAKFSLQNPSERSIGHLISFIQSSVYYLCLLLDVNWANNPKVNIGKRICDDALRNKKSLDKREKERKEIAEVKFKDFYKSW